MDRQAFSYCRLGTDSVRFSFGSDHREVVHGSESFMGAQLGLGGVE